MSESAKAKPRIFLSYARADDVEPFNPKTSFVARLHRDLEAKGLDVWFDRVDMPSRSLTFHQEIRDAIAERDRLALVVGPGITVSDYVRQEWEFAWREAGKVITPILRTGDYSLIPSDLKLLHCEDFRDDSQYDFHLDVLARQLRDAPPRLGKLIAVPSLPEHYLHRRDRLEVLRDAVRADLEQPVVIGGAAARVGLHGMGGAGKSMIAAALTNDRKIREAFPDGVVWVDLGQKPNLPSLMRQVHRVLGGDGAFETAHEGRSKLKDQLADRLVLLILDNAWKRADVDAFDVLGPRCRALVTTRELGLLTSLGGKHHLIDLLTDAEALDVLALTVGLKREGLPDEAREIIAECGRLPLAVALCGGMLKSGVPWRAVLDALREHDLEYISDEYRTEDQHENLWKAMEVSVLALSEDERVRFAELAVFPNDGPIPEAAILSLWGRGEKGLSERWAQKLLVKLKDRSLITLDRPPDRAADRVGDVSIHDILFAFANQLAKKLTGDKQAQHARLVEAYAERCPNGWADGPNDGYFFTHLFHHLNEAGRGDERPALLLNLPFLEAKTEAGHVFDLGMDFTRTLESLPANHPASRRLRLISQSLRRNINFIARHPSTLFQCLWNQCWWYDCPEAAAYYDPPSNDWPPEGPPWTIPEAERLSTLLESWRAEKERATPGFVWLRSLRPPEFPLGGAELICLNGHKGAIRCLAFDHEGQRLVTGSDDMMARVWDTKSGAELACLSGHRSRVLSVAFDREGRRIVTGSQDGTTRVWNAESGEELARLPRPTAPVPHPIVRIVDRWLGVSMLLASHREYDEQILKVAFDRSGRRVVINLRDGTTRVWDLNSDTELTYLHKYKNKTRSLAFDHSEQRVLAVLKNGTVRLWDVNTGREHERIPKPKSLISRLVARIAWCLWPPAWDRADGRAILAAAFDREGRRIVTGSRDGTARIWDVESGTVLAQLHERKGPASRLGAQILKCLAPRRTEHDKAISSVAFDWEGRRVVTWSSDGTTRVWDVESETEELRFHWRAETIDDLAADHGKQWITAWRDNQIERMRDEGNNARAEIPGTGMEWAGVREQSGKILSVAFDREGRKIATGSWEGEARIWNANSEVELARIHGHKGLIWNFAFDNQRQRLVTGSSDKTARVWDAATGAELTVLCGHTDWVKDVAFDHGGKRIYTRSWNETRVWDAKTWKCLKVLRNEDHKAAYSALGFSGSSNATNASPWRTRSSDDDVGIGLATDDKPIAWFPDRMTEIMNLSNRRWAGLGPHHLYLFKLEGDPPSHASTPTQGA